MGAGAAHPQRAGEAVKRGAGLIFGSAPFFLATHPSKNLKHAEDHTKKPTFQSTVRLVAERYELPDDEVEAELKRMINEGVVYSVSERSHWDYKVMLNILKVNWALAEQNAT